MPARADREFHRAMVAGAQRLKKEIGYNPARFLQIVGELGGTEAARRLLAGPNASDGFTTLWEHQRLEVSVEAFTLLPWYRELFDSTELETAERRLIEHGFDVDQHLRSASANPPAWASVGTV